MTRHCLLPVLLVLVAGAPGTAAGNAAATAADGGNTELAAGLDVTDRVAVDGRLAADYTAYPGALPAPATVNATGQQTPDTPPSVADVRQSLTQEPAEPERPPTAVRVQDFVRKRPLDFHGSLTLSIGSDDYWCTRLDLGTSFFDDHLHLGVSAAVGRNRWHD